MIERPQRWGLHSLRASPRGRPQQHGVTVSNRSGRRAARKCCLPGPGRHRSAQARKDSHPLAVTASDHHRRQFSDAAAIAEHHGLAVKQLHGIGRKREPPLRGRHSHKRRPGGACRGELALHNLGPYHHQSWSERYCPARAVRSMAVLPLSSRSPPRTPRRISTRSADCWPTTTGTGSTTPR